MFDLMPTGGRMGLFCVGVQLAKATFLILSKQLAPALLILRKGFLFSFAFNEGSIRFFKTLFPLL
jgi:hypothetical protein